MAKREGDMATPEGCFPLRRLLYRPDRESAPESGLPAAAIERDDGWCDDPADPFYNRPVTLPYPARAEALWRDDRLYDLLIVLGHNDDPVRPGAGSAIFLHLAAGDFRIHGGVCRTETLGFLGDCKKLRYRNEIMRGWAMNGLGSDPKGRAGRK